MFRSPDRQREIKIFCLGGDGGIVTGSCHRIETPDVKLVVDLGLYQGKDALSDRNEQRNRVPTKDRVDGATHAIITHSHIDHCGILPRIDGLNIKVLASEGTAHFMEPMLYNSAEIQQGKGGDRLYDQYTVARVLRKVKAVPSFCPIPVGSKNSHTDVTFCENGHVVGSSSVLIRHGSTGKTILFTGDIGRSSGQPFVDGYKHFAGQYPQDPIDVLVTECTNFEKRPFTFDEKRRNLIEGIRKAWANGGIPIIPSLSFSRFQSLVEMIENSRGLLLPVDTRLVIDAPFAVKLTEEYFQSLPPGQLSRLYGNDPDYYKSDDESIGRFDLGRYTIIKTHEDSINNDQRVSHDTGHTIVLASGGMGEHGRIVNYRKGASGRNPKNTFLLTCHQVEGTVGATMLRSSRIKFGEEPGALVAQAEGFTTHVSGEEETFAFFNRFDLSQLGTVLITHGNDSARKAMAAAFERRGYKAKIIMPALNQVVTV